MSKDPRKEASTIEMLMAETDDNGTTRIVGMDKETCDPATLTIKTQKWDEDQRTHVPDEETYTQAVSTLTEIGFGDAVQDGEILTEKIEQMIDEDELTYEGFYDPDNGFAKLTPINSFIRPQKIDAAMAKFLRKKENKTAVFESHPVTDWVGGLTYQILFPLRDENGEVVNLKVASIIGSATDEKGNQVKVSIKYDKGGARSIREKMEKVSDPERHASLKRLYEKGLANQKAAANERLREQLGWDIEKMIEEGATIKFSINLQQGTFRGETTYFIEAELESDDAEAVNSDLVQRAE